MASSILRWAAEKYGNSSIKSITYATARNAWCITLTDGTQRFAALKEGTFKEVE